MTDATVTLADLEEVETEMAREIEIQREAAYADILLDSKLARDSAYIRDRYRWIGYEIWCLGNDMFEKLLATPWNEIHNLAFPGADRIWQVLYWRATHDEDARYVLPKLLRVHDIHAGFAPPKANKGDNFYGVSYHMLLQSGAPETFLQTKPINQYWVKCDFEPEFFRNCWLPELLMRTYPPYVKELNRQRQLLIDENVEDALNGCNKRLFLAGSTCIVHHPVDTPLAPPSEHTPEEKQPIVPDDALKTAAQIWQSPIKEIPYRQQCHNLVQCLLHRRQTALELFEQLEGHPLVIMSYYVAAATAPHHFKPPVVSQIIDKKLSWGTVSEFAQEPGLRCIVSGFPRNTWLPVVLFHWIARTQCRCKGPYETCTCVWRNCLSAYEFIDRLVSGR